MLCYKFGYYLQAAPNKFKHHLIRFNYYHTFLNNYELKIKSGELKEDLLQRKIVDSFLSLDGSLLISQNYGILQRILNLNTAAINKGLYIYGSVGSGKTMLMNLFYDSCSEKAKKRIHFHEFMMEVHKKLHEVKQKVPPKTSRNKPNLFDPIPIVADSMCRDYRLLCFDEFQVTDIADAMILKRLFENIFRTGMFVIATSNRHPDDLYKHGLQRSNFVPFIGLLKEHCEILCLNSEIDYRKLILPSAAQDLYLTTKNFADPTQTLREMFSKMTNNSRTSETILTVFGRKVSFKNTIGPILYATFSELCQQPLSAADYLEISKSFHSVFFENIPQLKISQRNRLKRFITMIDAFYDNKIRFICCAEREPEELFLSSDYHENRDLDDKFSRRMLMDDLGLKETDATHRQSSIFTDEEELFSYNRTISRLMEMRTREYWNSSNHPLLKKTDISSSNESS